MHFPQNFRINKSWQTITLILFLTYLTILSYLLFFTYYRQSMRIESYNLTPFKTIKMYIQFSHHFHFSIWFSNLFGNILVFIPFGFLAPMLSKKLRKMKTATLAAFALSSVVEFIQWYFRVGGFDIDDIMLNTLGGSLGYLLLLFLIRLSKEKPAIP